MFISVAEITNPNSNFELLRYNAVNRTDSKFTNLTYAIRDIDTNQNITFAVASQFGNFSDIDVLYFDYTNIDVSKTRVLTRAISGISASSSAQKVCFSNIDT